jgi:hypothetical protein
MHRKISGCSAARRASLEGMTSASSYDTQQSPSSRSHDDVIVAGATCASKAPPRGAWRPAAGAAEAGRGGARAEAARRAAAPVRALGRVAAVSGRVAGDDGRGEAI